MAGGRDVGIPLGAEFVVSGRREVGMSGPINVAPGAIELRHYPNLPDDVSGWYLWADVSDAGRCGMWCRLMHFRFGTSQYMIMAFIKHLACLRYRTLV